MRRLLGAVTFLLPLAVLFALWPLLIAVFDVNPRTFPPVRRLQRHARHRLRAALPRRQRPACAHGDGRLTPKFATVPSLNADLCFEIARRLVVPGPADQAFAARIVPDAELDGG
jgi:hypothetical protein